MHYKSQIAARDASILQTIYHILLSLRETVDATPSYRQQRQPETERLIVNVTKHICA
jgi:hypothetical protein